MTTQSTSTNTTKPGGAPTSAASSTLALRHDLLELHRVMVDEERRAYESVHGKVGPGEFLQALVNDEAFAWLRPMTALIVELDEQEAASGGDRTSWVEQIRALLRPDPSGSEFQRRYDDLLQRSADVALAHGSMMRTMRG